MAWLNSLVAVLMLVGAQSAETALPTGLNMDAVRGIPVQYDSRWPPLDTPARDLVETITGRTFYHEHDPVLLLLAWTFDPRAWQQEPLIPIRNAELRAELQLSPDKTVFSYSELTNHQPLMKLIDDLGRVESGRKLDPLESKVSDLSDKLQTLNRVFGGAMIRIIPDPKDPQGAWSPMPAPASDSPAVEQARAAWFALGKTLQGNDAAALDAAAEQLKTALAALPSARRADHRLISAELRYNRVRPFRTAWMVMLAGAALATVSLFVRRRWFDALAVAGLLAGFLVLSYGLYLRWQIAGRIPATNMFESLLLLSWGMGAFAILSMIIQRERTVPLTASAMGALALILADVLPLDHFVRPAPPVLLDTIWMSIHVPIIMVSYAVLTLGMLIAHAQLISMAAVPRRLQLHHAIDRLHYWYIHAGSILLLIGILTGSMWAASSWGRYWGWDPKEVWSLVAFLGYMAIMHVRIDHASVPRWMYAVGGLLTIGLFAMIVPTLGTLTVTKILAVAGAIAAMAVFVLARGPFATALKSVLAFWLILMTYVGVNFVLGSGLHSYGFGTGAVVRNMFRAGATDLGLIALCCVVYLARRGARGRGRAEVRLGIA